VIDHDPASAVTFVAIYWWQLADAVEPHEGRVIGVLDFRPEAVVRGAELLLVARAEFFPVSATGEVLYAPHVRQPDDLVAGTFEEHDVPWCYLIVGGAAVL
jgi:hypothetical protein